MNPLPLLLLCLVMLPTFAHGNSVDNLPALGDSASSVVSLEQEHELGRIWLRQLRASVRTIDDPLAIEYLENLTYQLVPYSGAPQSAFEFVIVDQGQLNAFAVPGGIIGVNLGLFLHAADDDELASVLAHELAHLSQRHFARQLERANQRQPIALARILASILLAAATDNWDAGMAGVMASQAAEVQNQLAFSRDWEREADRVGMQTLAEAGFDPHAMPDMFTAMMAAGRLGSKPPEFLLTHPLTMNRVSDAAARAEQLPQQPRQMTLEFQLLKNRAKARYRLNDQQLVTRMKEDTRNPDAIIADAARITLADYFLQQQRPDEAREQLVSITHDHRKNSTVLEFEARLEAVSGSPEAALETLNDAQRLYPNSYSLKSTRATILGQLERYDEGLTLLRRLSEQRPTTPGVWYQLSEMAAAAEEMTLAYHARAEYLFLEGRQAESARQMDLAIQHAVAKGDYSRQAALKERLRQMANARQRLE